MRYAKRLDLVDEAAHVALSSRVLEAFARRLIIARRRAKFELWRTLKRARALVTSDRVAAPLRVRELSNGGAHDVLLVTDSPLSFPALASTAAELAQMPEHANAVAIIVADEQARIALSPHAGQARIMSMQRFWLDQNIDIANHKAVGEAFAVIRRVRDTGPLVNAAVRSIDMFEAINIHLHGQLISGLRMAGALRAAREGGARVVVVAVEGDERLHAYCQQVLSESGSRAVAGIKLRSFESRSRLAGVDLAPDLAAAIQAGRAHLARFRSDGDERTAPLVHGPQRHLDDRQGDAIALVSDAMPGSIYWPAFVNLTYEAKKSGKRMPVLVGRHAAARQLRESYQAVEVARPSIGATWGRDFAAAYDAMIDVLGRIADRDRMAMSGLARLALDNAILRLTLPFTIDFYGYRTYRLVDDMRRWLEASKVATLIVLPHWSRLGWAAISAARTLRIAIASTPAVTVAGNHASLVGWENIDLIGCYGSQCRDAFASVGIADEKLFLAGSLTLDHAFAITPEIARRSSPGIESATRTGRRLVLYATSGINADEAAILRAIIKVCADPAANACLVVRPHPSIGRASYAAALEGTPVELAQVETEGSIHDALVAAEFVVTDFSTAGAEAVLLGRPLLTVNTTGTPFAANDYAAFGVAVQACTLDEAGPLLRRLLDEGCFWPQAEAARARFIEAYNWQGDGRACRRFLEFIEQSTADDGDNLL